MAAPWAEISPRGGWTVVHFQGLPLPIPPFREPPNTKDPLARSKLPQNPEPPPSKPGERSWFLGSGTSHQGEPPKPEKAAPRGQRDFCRLPVSHHIGKPRGASPVAKPLGSIRETLTSPQGATSSIRRPKTQKGSKPSFKNSLQRRFLVQGS